MSATKHLTAAEFDQALKEAGDRPVLVDFFAEWCGPCKMAAPVVDELSQELAGKVDVYKVDVDAQGELAQRYGVMSIPTMIVFKKGKEANRQVGFSGKQGIMGMVDSAK